MTVLDRCSPCALSRWLMFARRTPSSSTIAKVSTSLLRFLLLCLLAVPVSLLSVLAAKLMMELIALLTQLLFFGRWSFAPAVPGHEKLGPWVILIPAAGAGIISLMARYGSRMIIGHGIPEVMQQILTNRSKISLKVAILKPLSSAISIGTGAPYGAEGPVVASGSAVGSLVGQLLTVTAAERKVLLAAGAAAGITWIFGVPVAATLLAVELLLFEFNPRSIAPVGIAAGVGEWVRLATQGDAALYGMVHYGLADAPLKWIFVFAIIGVGSGLLAVMATRWVHWTEHMFGRLPVHWMWQPVLGGLMVGALGWFEPRVFGSSYFVIEALLVGKYTVATIAVVCGLKMLAWVMSLGSGTSGGTLAPMLISGGGLGVLVAAGCNMVLKTDVPLGLAALVGMVSYFGSASHAIFASILMGVEMTHDALALWPLCVASAVALGVAHALSQSSIMSAPVELRGHLVPMSFGADVYAYLRVGQVMEKAPFPISPSMSLEELGRHIGNGDPGYSEHTALLVADENGELQGIITRTDLMRVLHGRGTSGTRVGDVMTKDLLCAYPNEALQSAIGRMVEHEVGRLPVIAAPGSRKIVGYLGRAAILAARKKMVEERNHLEPGWL